MYGVWVGVWVVDVVWCMVVYGCVLCMGYGWDECMGWVWVWVMGMDGARVDTRCNVGKGAGTDITVVGVGVAMGVQD